MLNLKIKEPDYKALYESRQAKIDSLNKTINGLKARNTKLENEVNQYKPKCKKGSIVAVYKVGSIVTLKEDNKEYEIAQINGDGTIRLKCDDVNHKYYSNGTIGCYFLSNIK
jgi:predicted RNA-binding protein